MSTLELRLLILIFTVVINLLLATFVYSNNPKSATNIIFGWLAIVTSLWLGDVYLSVDPKFLSHALLWIRVSIVFAIPQIALFYLLANTMPNRTIELSKSRQKLLLVVSLLLIGDAFSPLIFKKVEIIHNSAQATAGPGMLFFIIFALSLSILSVKALYNKLKNSQGYSKEQFRYVVIGIMLMLGLLFFTVLIPVAIFKNNTFVPFVPLYTIIFLGLTTYSIVAHKLFDIRAAVTRTVTYVLIVGSLSIVYGVVLFGVVDVLFSGSNNQFIRQVLSVVLVTPLALSFQSIKRFFDRITNKLFYRDSYDFQDVLDKIGNLLVAEIELYKILNGIELEFYKTLKPSFVEFVLFKKGKPYFEGYPRKIVNEDSIILGNEITKQKKELLVTDNLNKEHPLYNLLTSADVAVSLKLQSDEQVIGYLLFGHKRGGDIFTSQDEKLLLILAHETALAVQNALRFEEIRNFNLTLQASVEEATRNLRKVNAKLKTLDETKDDFISMASHQLRTPLTSVKGYLSMILEGDAGKLNKTQQEMLGQAFFSSQRMVYLIADMLNVSRLRTGKFVIENAPVNLAEIVVQEIDQLKETAAAHKVRLIYNQPKNFPILQLDETKIRQVIMNFADNAIYYTPQGGEITVELTNTANTVELRVIDNGIGVPKSEKHHLFTKFYRAGNARKARPDGTGLGLFMAKKVIVSQGGALIFDSVEGKGSTFGFVFNKVKLSDNPTKTEPDKTKQATPASKS